MGGVLTVESVDPKLSQYRSVRESASRHGPESNDCGPTFLVHHDRQVRPDLPTAATPADDASPAFGS